MRWRCTNATAEIVDAVGVVGVLVGEDHAVETRDFGVEQLLAQIRRSVHQHRGAAARLRFFDQRAGRRRFFGLFRVAATRPALPHARTRRRNHSEDREGERH